MAGDYREYTDPRATEYRLQPALATGIYYAHCTKQHRHAMLLHEDRSGSNPDIALIARDGRLWLYEVKRRPITRPAAAQTLCQLLCYASNYRAMSVKSLAKLYCEYKKRLGHTFYYPEVLQKRYEEGDQESVLREEFAHWFKNGGVAGVALGHEVARLIILAPAWRKDAISLVEQVRKDGIRASVEILKQYAKGRASSRWIRDVGDRAEGLEVFRKSEWVTATFRDPATWIEETFTEGPLG